MAVQLGHSSLGHEDDVPLIVTNTGVDVVHAQADTARTRRNDTDHIWSLMEALWGNIPKYQHRGGKCRVPHGNHFF